MLADTLTTSQQEADKAREQARAAHARQLAAETARHEACLREYSHSFSKQV